MESVNPFLEFVFELQIGLKSGHSLSTLLPNLIEGSSSFHQELQLWWQIRKSRGSSKYVMKTHHRQLLKQILEHGLEGGRVLKPLSELENDLEDLLSQNRTHYLEKLPFRLMIPLLLFVFPSFLILLFGPLIQGIYLEVLK